MLTTTFFTLMLIHFLVLTLKFYLFCFGRINMKKPPSKVACFSRNAEIFNTGLAVQTVQNAKFSFTRILLMQDWIFRLGVSLF